MQPDTVHRLAVVVEDELTSDSVFRGILAAQVIDCSSVSAHFQLAEIGDSPTDSVLQALLNEGVARKMLKANCHGAAALTQYTLPWQWLFQRPEELIGLRSLTSR
jgi:hypothetical protein